MLALKSNTQSYHILLLLFELFTIFWCNSSLIMVQLRTNFSSQQINTSFWCNIVQNYLECMSPKFCGHCISRTNARKFKPHELLIRIVESTYVAYSSRLDVSRCRCSGWKTDRLHSDRISNPWLEDHQSNVRVKRPV